MPEVQFVIDERTGLIAPARQLASPNCDARPDSLAPQLVVIHCISLPPGQYGGGEVEQFFMNQLDFNTHPYFQTIKELRVSAHVLVSRLGSVTQFVALHQRAWHAGVSEYKGRAACNDFSIGIELEGTEDSAFTNAQYSTLAGLLRAIDSAYVPEGKRLPVVGHSDIAPGRKQDPGSHFDWQRLNAGKPKNA